MMSCLRYFAPLLLLLSAACSSVPGVGSHPAPVPPQYIYDAAANVRIWDNTSAFGPVPANQAERGAKICSALNTPEKTYRAIGYHPRALDEDEKPIPGGGFLCYGEWRLCVRQNSCY